MKVLVITNLYPNKTEPNRGIFIKHQITALSKLCDVKVIAPIPFYKDLSEHIDKHSDHSEVLLDVLDGVEVLYPKYFYTPKIMRSLYGFFLLFSLYPLCKRLEETYKPDVYLNFWMYPDGFSTALLAKIFKKKFILSARGCDLNHFSQYYFRGKMISYASRNANLNLVLTGKMRSILRGFGVSDEKIVNVFNGIKTDLFFSTDRKKAREKLALEQDIPIILFIGRFSEEKGVENLISAFDKITDDSANLLLIGDGPLKAKIEKQVYALKLTKKVKFIGELKQSELPDWINAANLLCLPSKREGWPNIVMESLACGVPVVASNVGAIPEIITSEEYGYLAEPNNAEDLAEKLDMALKREWKKKSVSGNPVIRTWEQLAKTIFSLLPKAEE